jgi:hypothetical protein
MSWQSVHVPADIVTASFCKEYPKYGVRNFNKAHADVAMLLIMLSL